MRILVTGGSSFVGAHLCRLGAANHQLIAVYHHTPVALENVQSVRCDLADPNAIRVLRAQGADAIVHLACKVKRAPGRGEAVTLLNRRMMDTVLELGLPVVYASSTVVHWPRESAYGRGRLEDEGRLRASGLPWAVVRPCAPYGPALSGHKPHHRESFQLLADLVQRSPLVPVIGDGRYRRQPVYVDDFNGSILALLERGLTDQAFDSGGADALTFNEIVDTLARVLGHRRLKLHIPKRLFVRLSAFSRDFDQELIDTVDSDDVADPRPLASVSGLTPRRFAEGAVCFR